MTVHHYNGKTNNRTKFKKIILIEKRFLEKISKKFQKNFENFSKNFPKKSGKFFRNFQKKFFWKFSQELREIFPKKMKKKTLENFKKYLTVERTSPTGQAQLCCGTINQTRSLKKKF